MSSCAVVIPIEPPDMPTAAIPNAEAVNIVTGWIKATTSKPKTIKKIIQGKTIQNRK